MWTAVGGCARFTLQLRDEGVAAIASWLCATACSSSACRRARRSERLRRIADGQWCRALPLIDAQAEQKEMLSGAWAKDPRNRDDKGNLVRNMYRDGMHRRINLNSKDVDAATIREKVPLVGRDLAEKIVEYRKTRGRIQSHAELLSSNGGPVPGAPISGKTFEGLVVFTTL